MSRSLTLVSATFGLLNIIWTRGADLLLMQLPKSSSDRNTPVPKLTFGYVVHSILVS
jgi:hypothetical protein